MESIAGLQPSRLSEHIADTAFTDLNGLAKLKSSKEEGGREEAIKKVAQEFESMFIRQLLKTMRETNRMLNEDSMMNSSEVEFHEDMLDQQMSLTIASGSSMGKGMGIAEAMTRQLSFQYGLDKGNNEESVSSNFQDRRVFSSSPVVPSTTASANNSLAVKPTQPEKIDVGNIGEKQIEQKHVNQQNVQKEPFFEFDSPQDFVNKLYSYAKEAADKLGASAEVLLSQAALETGWGQHIMQPALGNSSHNLFGIKAHRDWQGSTVNKASLEYEQGAMKKVVSEFRSYDSFKDSFMDYVDFLQSHPRYEKALSVASDAKSYVTELQKAGYATDPDYANKILSIFSRLPTAVSTGRGL